MSGAQGLERLGKYEIRSTLGRGAMGTVYEAWDPVIARKVAIKTVSLPDASDSAAQDELARFQREAQAAGRLNHPNIVGVFDYGEAHDLAYIVMEFVDGHTLRSVIEKQGAVRPAGDRPPDERADGRPAIQPRPRRGSSRYQAGQPDPDVGRHAEDRRFRHRPNREQQHDPGGHRAGHADLYVARTVHGPNGRSAHRYLFVWGAALSAADRRAPVRWQHGHDHAQGAEHDAARAVRAVGHDAAQFRRRRRAGDGEAAGASLRQRK